MQLTERIWPVIFNASPNAIVLADLQADILDCNPATLTMYDTNDKDMLVGKNILQFVDPKDQDQARQNLEKTLQEGINHNNEYALLNKHKVPVQVLLSSSLIRNEAGEPEGFLFIMQDITERKRAAEALSQAHRDIKKTLEKLPAHVFRFRRDQQGNIIAVLSEGRIATENHITTREIKGKHLNEIMSPKNYKMVLPYYREAFEGKPTNFEIPMVGYWFHTVIIPYAYDTHGNVSEVVGYTHDITQRKQADLKLQKRMDDIRHMNRLMVGRENRMVALKQEVNQLLKQLGKPPKYDALENEEQS